MVVVDITELVRVFVQVREEVDRRSPQRAVSPAMAIDAMALQDRIEPHCLDEIPGARVVPEARHVEDLQVVVVLTGYIDT